MRVPTNLVRISLFLTCTDKKKIWYSNHLTGIGTLQKRRLLQSYFDKEIQKTAFKLWIIDINLYQHDVFLLFRSYNWKTRAQNLGADLGIGFLQLAGQWKAERQLEQLVNLAPQVQVPAVQLLAPQLQVLDNTPQA